MNLSKLKITPGQMNSFGFTLLFQNLKQLILCIFEIFLNSSNDDFCKDFACICLDQWERSSRLNNQWELRDWSSQLFHSGVCQCLFCNLDSFKRTNATTCILIGGFKKSCTDALIGNYQSLMVWLIKAHIWSTSGVTSVTAGFVIHKFWEINANNQHAVIQAYWGSNPMTNETPN